MSLYGDVDEHIERLRNGGTLTENEVKNLCEKVRTDELECTGLDWSGEVREIESHESIDGVPS
jgi:hypothetical protein